MSWSALTRQGIAWSHGQRAFVTTLVSRFRLATQESARSREMQRKHHEAVWFPYNKGGGFPKMVWKQEYVVNWE